MDSQPPPLTRCMRVDALWEHVQGAPPPAPPLAAVVFVSLAVGFMQAMAGPGRPGLRGAVAVTLTVIVAVGQAPAVA